MKRLPTPLPAATPRAPGAPIVGPLPARMLLGRALIGLVLFGCGGASVPQLEVATRHTAAPVIEVDGGADPRPNTDAITPPAPPAASTGPASTAARAGLPPAGFFEPDAPVVIPDDVAAHVRSLVRRFPQRRADVFAKIGDSATVSRAFLRCFGTDEELELAGRDELRPMIERVRRARVRSRSSFTRESQAAMVGRSVHQLMRGSPSPIAAEVRDLSPRYAFVMFGGNDIEMGRLDRYATQMLALVDLLLARGVVPILSTIPPRGDDAESDAQVPRYDAVIEAIARGRRVPLIDLHRAMESLPRRGLARDGVHPNAPVVDGRAHACDFTAHGLEYGMNVRNLLSLQMLTHLAGLIDADSSEPPPTDSTGTPEPRRAVSLGTLGAAPLAVIGTTEGRPSERGAYEGCAGSERESGPEQRYSLHVDSATAFRAEVMYGSSVDVDIHLLRAGRCLARGDRRLERVLEAGDYELVVDTFERASNAGEFLLLLSGVRASTVGTGGE